MKINYVLVILLILNLGILKGQDLCKECSQNIGGGFSFTLPDPTKGAQLISSAVGIIASEPINSSDGSVLISGYMPVCVVPILGLGDSDTSICSNKELTLSSNAYLIDNINWEDVTKSLNFIKEGIFDESIRLNHKVDKVEKFKIKVAAEKGGIKSIDDEIEVSFFPGISPTLSNLFSINDTNIVCNNKDVVINIADEYYSLDSLEITWNDTNLKSFTENIEIKSELVTKTVTIRNKNNPNLCDTTFTLNFNPIKPNATVSIQSKDNITVLNPADYENIDNTFYFAVSLDENKEFDEALKRCPPTSFEADVEISSKLFYPIGNFSVMSENSSYKIIKYSGTLNSFKSEDKVFKIDGIPILVDQTNGEIKVNNFKFFDIDNNDKIYKINNGNPFEFSLIYCDDFNGEKRLLKDYLNPMIKNVYPNPTNSMVNIELNHKVILGELISIKVFDVYGFEVYDFITNANKVSDKIQISMPKYLSSGNYKTIVSDGINSSSFDLLIVR